MTADTPAHIGVRRSDDELRTLVEQAAPRLAEASAEEALRWAAETFGDWLIVASNMQDSVLVDLAAKAAPGVDVLFLETGYQFAETIDSRDVAAQIYLVYHAHTYARQPTLLSAAR